jgi:hypothetical protein
MKKILRKKYTNHTQHLKSAVSCPKLKKGILKLGCGWHIAKCMPSFRENPVKNAIGKIYAKLWYSSLAVI